MMPDALPPKADWRSRMAPPALSPDTDQARRHIEALTGSAKTPVRLRIINPETKAARTLEPAPLAALWPAIEAAQAGGENVYSVVNEGGDTDASIARVRALFADGDGIPQPVEWHAVPDLILARDAMHWHAYWLVKDMAPADFKTAQRRLAEHYGTDRTVCNASRVMRLAGTAHHKGGITSRGYVIESATRRGDASPAADILAGLPEIVAKVEAAPSAAAGEPVTLAQLRAMLSHVDPTFKDAQLTWLGIAKAIRWSQLPITESLEGDAWADLADEWCSGALWRERTGDKGFEVATYQGRDELLARLADAPRDTGAVIGMGSIVSLARAAGYSGQIMAIASPAETFAKAATDFFPDAGNEAPALPLPGIILRPVSMQKTRRRITPLIEGFIPDGGTVIIHAPFNSYKSFAATDIICAVASGRPAFGRLRVNRTGPAIYIMGEGISGFETERRPAWCIARKAADDDTLPVYTIDGVPYAREPGKAVAYFEAIKALGVRPGVVIIDTLARAMTGLNENDAGDAGLYLELVETMAKALDCAVVTIAHEGKDGERGARGSSAFAAGFDNVWRMEADTENLTARIVPVKLKDDAGVEAIHLKGQKVPMPGAAKAGLVFNVVHADEYKQARGKSAGITRSDVGQALKALGAQHGQSVSTRVLAIEVAGTSDDELLIQATARNLQRGTKDRFAAYVAHLGNGGKDPTLWQFPASKGEGQADA